jgi:phenylacetate-CoA ligase
MRKNYYRFLSDIYGQLMGYKRLAIRRAVERNARCSPAELKELQKKLFQARVHDAISRFPMYAEKVRSAMGKIPSESELILPEQLPIWTRADQRKFFDSLTGPPLPESFKHSTGGSSGEPVHFYITRESYEWRCAVSDRGYAWAGAEEGRRSFYVWGEPAGRRNRWKDLRRKISWKLQQRVCFDSFLFDDERKKLCCEMIDRFKPYSIVGYAGNLVELALFVRKHPEILHWKAQTVVTAAERLYPGQRELLEEVLGNEVFMSYGSREFMLIGMECHEHTGYHVMCDNVMVEIVDENGMPIRDGETGRILVTDLHNLANPFIRYEIGDLGAWHALQEGCPCGLPFPLMARVDGRSQEFIRLQNGRTISALFFPHLMKEFKWIRAYQIIQNSADTITINLITDSELKAQMIEELSAMLSNKIGGNMRILFRRVDTLIRNRAGKVPIVIHEENVF